MTHHFLFVQKQLNNQRGIIAVDYLFAFVIAMGLFTALLALSLTLSVAEITQYIAFSSARSFAAAHRDQPTQEALARNKFNELKKNPVFAPFFTNGWFQIEIENVKGGGATALNYSDDYQSIDSETGDQRTPAVGIRLFFTSRILNFRNPYLGNATSEEEEGFKTKVTGLMKREPSAQECLNQMKREVRYSQILKLDSRYGVLGNPAQPKYTAVEDNGC